MSKTFQALANKLGEKVAAKNLAYGNAAVISGKILELIFPDGVPPSKYRDLLLISRILDKIMRIANKKDAFGESPYEDLMGYGLIGLKADEEEKCRNLRLKRRKK